ncbi:hypothetical protein V2H45_13975 [Tumidithrix elongata RA019]|uniref:Uncharacterized protein n=1 Tax=Tumidithrix elongata BACA0141 TaxID=2716417 RepID=A0AAW9PTD8_9CYAN|nr:hypothetical protein [Tumidithrix elongata RA019]
MVQTNTINLWPEDLVGVPDTTPPITILRQQATMLSQLTRNILEGEVVSEPFGNDPKFSNSFTHNFYIKAPAIGGYRYKLFYVQHAVSPEYPLRIVKDELPELSAQNEEQFYDVLRQIFNSDRTKKVIRSLMAQSVS